MTALCSKFLNESPRKHQNNSINYRSLKAEDRRDTISEAIFFVSRDRHIFCGYRLYSLSGWCLSVWIFQMKGLIYNQHEKNPFLFPTLDGSASILIPKWSMNFFHLIISTVKMGSRFSLFSATILKVSKIDPGVILSSCKRCEMLTFSSPSIL